MRRCLWGIGVAIATSLPGIFGLPPGPGAWGPAYPLQTPDPLSQTPPVPPARAFPAASPVDTVLKLGSQGEAVTRLQQILGRLGYYAGPVDGQYGAATSEAVVAFQTQYGPPADGVVRVSTWYTLHRALEARIRVARLNLRAVTPPSFSTLTPVATPPPPAPIWLLLMPLLPLLGGGLTYLVRRAQSRDPFSGAPNPAKPPKRSP